MKAHSPQDPIGRFSRSERRQLAAAARQAVKDHESEQLATLRGIAQAGGAVTRVEATDSPSGIASALEIVIEGRRLRAGRVYRPTMAVLKDALSSITHVPLAGVSRYGSYWVLTFKLATEPLVMLVDRLTLLPDWGGSSPWSGGSGSPLAQLAV